MACFDYSFVGCDQTYPHGRGHGSYEGLIINSAKPLEPALNNGIDPMTGEREGPRTGTPEGRITPKAWWTWSASPPPTRWLPPR